MYGSVEGSRQAFHFTIIKKGVSRPSTRRLKMAIVYAAMSADILHHGHIRLLEEAQKYGDVIVGLHTDKVIASCWHIPILSYEERYSIVSSIRGISEVVPQEELDQVPNLKKYKPDFVIHGDNWKNDSEKHLREKVIEVLKEWGGKLIEVKYTEGNGVENMDNALSRLGTTTDFRRGQLRKLLSIKGHVNVMEAHNGLTGLIVEKTKHYNEDGTIDQFDAMWVSSLCDSTSKGKPDIELVDLTSRVNTINEIMEVTTKPIIVDGDTGGKIEHFIYTVRTLERLGVSAIIIEDKVGLKKNSLFGTEAAQTQDSVEHFCKKITSGKNSQITSDFMIIARIESLILKQGMEDALKRAEAYIAAGADGIMIHSIDKTGEEIKHFCRKYNCLENRVPLVVVPTAYNQIYEEELYELGVNVYIYANHLIRAGYKAMSDTASSILDHHRSYECNDKCMSIREIINLIDLP